MAAYSLGLFWSTKPEGFAGWVTGVPALGADKGMTPGPAAAPEAAASGSERRCVPFVRRRRQLVSREVWESEGSSSRRVLLSSGYMGRAELYSRITT